jgi:DNA-binding GntR family transcriptional regulator
LAEQKLATHFGVSRTLVRQALFQLSQNRLIRMEPARGAFVAAPSADEAKQVFAVRRMLEVQMTREFVRDITPAKIRAIAPPHRLMPPRCSSPNRLQMPVLLPSSSASFTRLLF